MLNFPKNQVILAKNADIFQYLHYCKNYQEIAQLYAGALQAS